MSTTEPAPVPAVSWLTPNEVAGPGYWPGCPFDASHEDDHDELERLLEAARTSCQTFAPALAPGSAVPESYRRAQALQARAIFRAGVAGSGDSLGGEGMSVTVFPMDWTVKALLRPAGKPVTA